ncbi:MAG TPA: hypothetical protein VF341_09850 [Anaeromyxobacteraceae bacterium]
MALARRIDRLARRAHRFHRFAHHPLCAAYDGETFQVGRRGRVCRGCAAVALGGVLGVGLGLALPVPPGVALVGLLIVAAVAFAAVSMGGGGQAPALHPDRAPRPRPPHPGPLPRRGRGRTADLGGRASKLLTRTLPAASAACLAVLGARATSVAGLTVAAGALALVGGGVLAYRRRGPDRSPCVACPERGRPQVCSGFAPMARREKAFSRLAARLLRTVPPPPAAR